MKSVVAVCRRVAPVSLLMLLAAGCGAQVTPSKADVVWSWTPPAACTATAPCSYFLSVQVVPSGTASCPASTGASYTPVNGGAAIGSLSYTDTGEALGSTVCAVAQTLQNGLTSEWSAPSSPVVMPVKPPVPSPPSGQEKAAKLRLPNTNAAHGGRELALSGAVEWR